MKLIEAAEEGYASANTYFLALWAVIIVVGLTAFFEMRDIENQHREADRVIALYDDLIIPAEATENGLVRVVAASPYVGEPQKLFAEMRSNALHVPALLSEVQTIIARRTDLSTADRQRINLAINPMLALLMFNIPAIADIGLVPIEDEQGLLLVLTDPGTFGLADTVGDLRIQDAVRYLWLAAIPMRDMRARADELKRLARSENAADVEALIIALEDFAERAARRTTRDTARTLWFKWLDALPSQMETPKDMLERRAMEQLTLSEPRTLTIEAFRAQTLADARASGGQVDVSIPGIKVPIRLSDALIFLPVLVGFFLLAIFIYTSRGLRYGTKDYLEADKDQQTVGKTPVYYALYGVTRSGGWVAVVFALGAPVAIAGWLGWQLVPFSLTEDWAKTTFQVAFGADVILLLMVVFQAGRVVELIDEGIVLKGQESPKKTTQADP